MAASVLSGFVTTVFSGAVAIIRSTASKTNSFVNNELQPEKRNGGGGIRTPVPRCFEASVYMLSRYIVFFTLPSATTTGSWLSYFG